MRRRLFVTVLAMIGAISLAGCGSSGDSRATVTSESSTVLAENTTDESVAKDILEDEAEQHESEEAIPEQSAKPEEPEAASESVNVEPEIEGIITLQVNYTNMSYVTFDVNAIDPDTGDYHGITSFLFKDIAPVNADEYTVTPANGWSRYGNYRDLFNEDYTLMAATKTFVDNKEKHAGWVDQSGTFFDVTIALNQQSQSDFDPIMQFEAVGFTPDGQSFCYVDNSDRYHTIYYLVPLDSISPGASYVADDDDVYVMNMQTKAWQWMKLNKKSCMVDENRFLMVLDSGSAVVCALAESTAQTITPIVPGESQISWSPVLSPDGTSVALMAAPKKGTDSPSIYLTNLEGSSPTKLTTPYSPICDRVAGNGTPMWQIMVAYHYAGIMEWR